MSLAKLLKKVIPHVFSTSIIFFSFPLISLDMLTSVSGVLYKSNAQLHACPAGGASDSEEDRDPEAQIPQKPVSAWDNKHKQSADQEGYSSEASSGQSENNMLHS